MGSQFFYRVVLAINPRKQFLECCQSVAEHADYVHLVTNSYCLEVDKLGSVLTEQCGFDEDRISGKGGGDITREMMFTLNECWSHNHSMRDRRQRAQSRDRCATKDRLWWFWARFIS